MLNLSRLINLILTNYFQHFYCIFLISDYSIDFTFFNQSVVIFNISQVNIAEKCDYFNDTLEDFEMDNTVFDLNNYCEGFIISTQYPKCIFDSIEDKMHKDKKSPYKFNDRKYLFLLDEYVGMNEVYKSVYDKNVPATFVVKSNEMLEKENIIDNDGIYYNVFSIISDGPNRYKEILLDKWFFGNKTFLYGNDLFPDQVQNLQEKQVKVASINYNPYVILGSTYFDSYGIDMRLIQEFIKRHNGTPVFKMLNADNWGVQYDNKSEPTGLTAEVAYNKVDIVLGGFIYIYYSYHFLDFAKPHYNSLLKVMVPKPKLLSQIPLAFYPFPHELWIIITIIYITSIITLFLASISPKLKNTKSKLSIFRLTVLNVFGIYLQQPNYLYRIAMNYKIAIISTFGMSLFMSMAYNSRMSSLMIVPRYEKPIRKLDDFIKSDLKVGTTAINDYLLLVVNSDREIDKAVLKHFVEFNLTILEEITVTGNIGRLTEITAFENYALNGIQRNGLIKLQVMDDSICYYHLLLCTKKNFPFMTSFNKLIGRVVESGLTKYWENEAILFNSTVTLQNVVKFSTRRDSLLRKLRLEQIAGALVMLFLGLFLSTIAFIFEKVKYQA